MYVFNMLIGNEIDVASVLMLQCLVC